MKPLLAALGVAGLLLGLAIGSEAQQSERVYPIFELTDEDVALIDVKDGSIGDWLEVVGEPSMTALDFEAYMGPATRPSSLPSYDPYDLDFRIWLAWHRSTSHIYVAMERADDVYNNTLASGQWSWSDKVSYGTRFQWDGHITFCVDADRSGGQWMWSHLGDADQERLLSNGQAQGYGAIAEWYREGHRLGLEGPDYDPGLFCLRPPFAEVGGAAFGDQPVVSVTEFYVTAFDRLVWDDVEASVASDLYPGKIVGICIWVIDNDGNYDHDEFAQHSDFTWHSLLRPSLLWSAVQEDSGLFAPAMLVGPGGGVPDDSAVEGVAWGRIKGALPE